MECDIHAYIEIKLAGNWLYYAPANISRNYDVFARMADVRNCSAITPLAEPRGLPGDITPMTRMHHDDRGGHSESWLSHDELISLIKWEPYRGQVRAYRYGGLLGVYFFGNMIEDWRRNRAGYPKEIEDVRLVFWFDS